VSTQRSVGSTRQLTMTGSSETSLSAGRSKCCPLFDQSPFAHQSG
jgi:hypothetical protein